MDKGADNHNWFSLSISEYIRDCKKAIDEFKDTKSRVLHQAQNIEKNVMKIENAVLVRDIDWERSEPMDIIEFSEYFDSHRQKVLEELVNSYKDISDKYLRSIEECTVKTSTQGAEEMRTYYYYWERRIFNALTKMTIRAMAAIKTLFARTDKRPPLLKVSAEFTNPEITYHPSRDELENQLEKFSKNVLESTSRFGRWWDGFCIIFQEKINPETTEKCIPFTFYDDVVKNPVIVMLNYEICQSRNQAIEKVAYHTKAWKRRIQDRKLWDNNEKNKMQRSLDRNPSTHYIERFISYYKRSRTEIESLPKDAKNFFMVIDNSEVISSCLQKFEEWLKMLGNGLKDIASKELNMVIRETNEYLRHLNQEPGGIDSLKFLLNTITEIKNKSMEMEFRINDV